MKEPGDDFGHWLAGLSDGEGCFLLNLARERPLSSAIRPQFSINLRADDRPILLFIAAQLGFGHVSKAGGGEHSPMACYRVAGVAACLSMVELFDRYPLRTRKRADYVIWRKAVLERAKGRSGDADYLLALREELMGGRALRELKDAARQSTLAT